MQRLRDGDQALIDDVAAERDGRVTAHGRITFIMQEEHREVRAGQVRLDGHHPVHVVVTPRLEDQQFTQMVEMVEGVAALVQDRLTQYRRIARRDDTHGLAARVHVHRLDGSIEIAQFA